MNDDDERESEARALAEAIDKGAYDLPADALIDMMDTLRKMIEPAGHTFLPAEFGNTVCTRCGLVITVRTAYLAMQPCVPTDGYPPAED